MTYQYPLSDFFRGSGGGKGGGGGGGKKGGGDSDANTLRSKARARMLEAISEGPIVGLVDENGNLLLGDNIKKAIYFDQTPIWNTDGSENFKNVLQQQHFGHADEGYFNGHQAVETPSSVEVRVRQNTGPVQRTIVDENADAIRVIVRLPSLVRNDKENGGLKRTSVAYAFEVRGHNGTWQRVVENHVNDQKATSAFQIAHKIALPAGGSPWDVRMIRLTADSDDTELQNETWWEGYIVLVEGKFIYPYTAMVGMEVNAEDMGSNIPPRSYRVKGLIIQVPSNYNPETRVYTGIWDGTFKWAWTNNPAWIFYDLLTNDRYGLGEFVNPAIVDKWSLYTIAQYCDQSVRTGYKNGDTGQDIFEPRFTFNGVINSRDDAYVVLQQVSTAWRGMAYWSLGQVFATADMPSDPVKLVAPANVIGGEFNYSGTAIKARHSVIIVSWNDPNDHYRPATEIVINQDMLNKYGWREKRLQLTGCTSRGLAHRYGKWVLDTEQHENETVEYQASWDHVDARPGDIVAVADPRKAQIRLGGRLADVRVGSGLVASLDYTSGEYMFEGIKQAALASTVLNVPLKPYFDEFSNLVGNAWQPVESGAGRATLNPDGSWSLRSFSGSGDRVDLDHEFPTIPGRRYRFRALVSENNIGVAIGRNRASTAWAQFNSIGQIEGYFTANDTSGWLRFFKTANNQGTIANIEIRELIDYTAEITRTDGSLETVSVGVSAGNGWNIPSRNTIRTIEVRSGNRSFATSHQVELDYDFEPLAGQAYHLTVTLPDGSLEKRKILRFIDKRTVQLEAPFSQTPVPNAMFVITGDVVPRHYRILSVDETEPNIFKITGLFHDPNKFARVEQDIIFDPLPYQRPPTTTQPPTGLLVKEVGYVSAGQGFHSLHVSWTPPADFMNRGFIVSVEVPEGGIQILGTTQNPWFEMQNTDAGTYRFMVQTIGFNGVPSAAAEFIFTAAGPDGFAKPTVTNLRLRSGTGNTFSTPDLVIEWDNNFALSSDPTVPGGVPQNVASPHYTFNTVKVFNNATGALLRTARVTSELFTYELATNAADSASAALAHPSRSLRIEVTVSDIFGRESVVATQIFTNPAPAAITPSFATAGASIVMSYPAITDADFRGVKVWRSSTSPVNVSGAPLYDGLANPLTMLALPNSTYFYRVAAYDAFSPADAVLSGEFTVSTGYDVFDSDPPERPTGLTLTHRVETVDGIATRMMLRAEVNLATEEDFASYDFEIKEAGGNWLSFSSAVNTYEWPVLPTQTYQVRVRALDRTFNTSVRTDPVSITLPTHPGLAAQINAGSTQIDPGKIRVSGATTLADWRRGGDETKIDGGALSANTVQANAMVIGQRGVTLEGVEFEHNKPAANQVSWTAGSISYINDAGVATTVAVTSAHASWTGGTLYLFWAKGAASISATSVFSTAMHANNIILATYRGGRDINANYGRTVIDGAGIKTGSITADVLGVSQLSALTADLGEVTAGRARSPDSKFVIDFNQKFMSIEV